MKKLLIILMVVDVITNMFLHYVMMKRIASSENIIREHEKTITHLRYLLDA